MKKNKMKVLLAIIIMLLSVVLFADEVSADQAMALKCNITTSKYDDGFYSTIYKNEVGEKIFVRLTDNDGKPYWNYSGNITKLVTIPEEVWIKNIDLSDLAELEESEQKDYFLDINTTFNAGACPQHISKVIDPTPFFDTINAFWLRDIASPVESPTMLEKPRYIIYSISHDGVTHTIAEGYNNKGAYSFVGPDIVTLIKDEVTSHQSKLIENIGYNNYFKVDEVYESLLVAGRGETDKYSYSVCEDHDEEWCENNFNFKIHVASSGKGKANLENAISDWINIEKNQGQFSAYNDILDIVKDEKFMNVLKAIKEALNSGKEYNFDGIDLETFISKLEKGSSALDKAFNVEFTDCGYPGTKTNITSSITSCLVYSDMLGVKNLAELADKNSSENIQNKGFIISQLYTDVHDTVANELSKKNYPIDILDSSDNLSEYSELMYTAVAYLKSRADKLEIDKEKIKDIYTEYSDLVEKYKLNIYPVVDCESLLGEDLIEKINSYLDIVKIAIPIILIGLGIADFAKAVFAGDEDVMKKAQKQFLMRLVVAILIFFTPMLVNALLSLANKVWTIISPDACGLFQ